MIPGPELIGGTYLVCHGCKEGKFESVESGHGPTGTSFGPPQDYKNFRDHHAAHEQLELVIGTVFLADLLPKQYIDVDRPDLEPIVTHIGGVAPPAANAPLGTPGGVRAALELQRSMRSRSTPPAKPKVIQRLTNEAELLAAARLVLADTRRQLDDLLRLEGQLQMRVLELERLVGKEEESSPSEKL